MRKFLLYVVLWLFCIDGLQSQYYIDLGDNVGVDVEQFQASLDTAAKHLVEAFPSTYQDSFRVFSTGFYLHSGDFESGYPGAFDQAIVKASVQSKYFLLIGRQSDETGIYTRFFVKLRLPRATEFNCYNNTYYVLLESKVYNAINNTAISQPSMYVAAEKEGINLLKTSIESIVICCDDDIRTSCDVCPSVLEIRQSLTANDFVEIDADIIECIVVDNAGSKEILTRMSGSSLLELSEINVLDGDTVNLGNGLNGIISDVLSNGFSCTGILTSDLNCCYPEETSLRSTTNGTYANALELFNTSTSDIIIWIHASPDAELGDRIYIKVKSKIDSYESLVTHDDMNDIVYSAAADVYPSSILEYSNPTLSRPYGSYYFNLPATRLLSLVAEVPEMLINQTLILKRAFGQYLPWYSVSSEPPCGLAGITLGDAKLGWFRIYYTENMFRDGTCGFGNDMIQWLSISAHEVRHLIHILAITPNGGLKAYIGHFAYEYVRHMSHDAAPSEAWAEIGTTNFEQFHNWIKINKGVNALEDLFNSNQGWVTKADTIEEWWDEYQ